MIMKNTFNKLKNNVRDLISFGESNINKAKKYMEKQKKNINKRMNDIEKEIDKSKNNMIPASDPMILHEWISGMCNQTDTESLSQGTTVFIQFNFPVTFHMSNIHVYNNCCI